MWWTARVLCWEIHKLQRYLHPGFNLRATDNVLDVGGNLGIFTLWAAPQVPQGRVVTVEPTPSAHRCLTLNIEKNSLANVTAMRAAVGANDGGEIDMVTYPGIEALSHVAHISPNDRRSCTCQMSPLVEAGDGPGNVTSPCHG
jgi:FkbM family methyltransferase